MRTNGDTLIHRQTVNDPTGAAMTSMTIDQWCKSHAFSRGHYYKLKKRLKAPKKMKIGRCVRITPESDAEWVRAREAETAETELAETAKTELQGGDDDD
jgi:predicted DNA-binding transcriptional regulator AlpA